MVGVHPPLAPMASPVQAGEGVFHTIVSVHPPGAAAAPSLPVPHTLVAFPRPAGRYCTPTSRDLFAVDAR
jgi:hypothetical protein